MTTTKTFQGVNRGKELFQDHRSSCAPNFYQKKEEIKDNCLSYNSLRTFKKMFPDDYNYWQAHKAKSIALQ